MSSLFKIIQEMGPIIAFFVSYKFYGIFTATAVMLACSVTTLLITYIKTRKIAFVPLFSTIILLALGGITLYTSNTMFIKMKPTIINLLFAAILLGGVLLKKAPLKYVLGHAANMPDSAWQHFSARFGVFFALLAVANEIVWRNFAEHTWVQFKVFGILPLTIIFLLTQMPFLHKHNAETQEDKV